MIEASLQWVSPAPMWADASAGAEPKDAGQAFRRPAILRFATDNFMDEFLALMEADPAQLGGYQARPETWLDPMPSPDQVKRLSPFERSLRRRQLAAARASTLPSAPVDRAGESANGAKTAPPGRAPLKLFQPAHQRFYLVTACLVCRLPRLPDRAIDPGQEERATFVVRRLRLPNGDTSEGRDPARCEEYAFVQKRKGPAWEKVAASDPAVLVSGEEQLPLFGVSYRQGDGRNRRLLAGLVPVGKREVYLGAASAEPADGQYDQAQDARLRLLQTRVTAPWKSLIDQASLSGSASAEEIPVGSSGSDNQTGKMLRESRERIQTGSWYALLDFAKYLAGQAPDVWSAITGESPRPAPGTPQAALIDTLEAAHLGDDLRTALLRDEDDPTGETPSAYTATDLWGSLKDALVGILAEEEKLEGVTTIYDRKKRGEGWPTFLFPLADPVYPAAAPFYSSGGDITQGIDELEAKVMAALPTEAQGPVPETPQVFRPVMDARGGDWFVIRCVFERPKCGPLDRARVSERTEAFQLAGFFDPDAPARPVRIALPVDVSPAGLRKFDKNAAFVMSDMLCGHIKRMQKLSLGDLVRSVLPWPLHKDLSVGGGGPCTKDGDAVGMICSISIPIVTLCALILMMIIVALLDFIFRWIPYLFICFPIPKFKAKEGG